MISIDRQLSIILKVGGFLLLLFLLSPQFSIAGNDSSGISELNISKPGTPRFVKFKQALLKFRHQIRLKKGETGEKAIYTGLALTLGAFGVHRIYLGTEDHVPFIYAVTLGGGLYLVPVVDIIMVLSSRDIEKFQENPHFIMWGGE